MKETENGFYIKPVAHIRTDFPTKFGIPRQSNIVSELTGEIIFEEEFRSPEAVRGIEGYSHLWLIWQFSENTEAKCSPTVRPPVLGGNERVGVFATRSPFRPNFLGLSCVKLEGIRNDKKNGTVLLVSGVDMMDNTPIFDIKPYIPMWDSKPDAKMGFAGENRKKLLKVQMDETMLPMLTSGQKKALRKILEQDPRPAYQNDPDRVYGFVFAGIEVKFKVQDEVLVVIEAVKTFNNNSDKADSGYNQKGMRTDFQQGG